MEEQGSGLQVPLLAKVQVARRGMPFHRVVYHPSAGGMADYLVCYHCAFILRLHSLPAAERFNLANNPVAEEDCLKWAKAHEGSDPSDADRQTEVAGFLRTALMTMVRSEVVDGLVWALRVLAGMGDSKARQQLVLRAALLGQSGIDLLAPEPVHSLDGYDGGSLTGFQVGCLIHAGVQGLSPGTKTGGTHHRGGVEAGAVAGS